jgi:homoserine kinase
VTQRHTDPLPATPTQGLPLGSGLGSSAASAAAAAWAVNGLFGCPLSKSDLLPAGLASEAAVSGYHADNVAPSLMGGFVLVRCGPATSRRTAATWKHACARTFLETTVSTWCSRPPCLTMCCPDNHIRDLSLMTCCLVRHNMLPTPHMCLTACSVVLQSVLCQQSCPWPPTPRLSFFLTAIPEYIRR